MRNQPISLVLLALFLTLLLSLPTGGCQKKPQAKPARPTQQATTSGQKTKAPKTAQDILKQIDKVLLSLDKKAKQQSVPQLAQQKQTSGQQGQTQGGQGGQSSGKEKKGSSGGQGKAGSQGQGGGATAQEQMANWQDENASLKKIHQSWNALEPEAIKAGLSVSDRQAFEAALDKLTNTVGSQDLQGSLLAATTLYQQFARVVNVFSFPIPQDYFRVKYDVMAAMAQANGKAWTTASGLMQDITEPWNHLRMQLGQKNEKDATLAEFSIKDLEQAISQRDIALVAIKGEIAMNNLKKLEEKLAKSSGGSGGQ